MKRYTVGVLGATGLVGRRLVRRLVDHPWFDVGALGASERSRGQAYGQLVGVVESATAFDEVLRRPMVACRPEAFAGCDLVLSALDAPVARTVEPLFVAAGFAVVSNSSAFRDSDDVPLIVPEINPEHLDLVHERDGGCLVTNPNCSVAGLVVALAPLHADFGLRRVVVTTMQALSGAGITGPSALDLVDNVLPHIPGEEEKIERELAKILGASDGRSITPADVAVSAHCHRVGVRHGHLEAVSIEFDRPPAVDDAARSIAGFRGRIAEMELPSAAPLLRLRDEPDRPQPRLDRDEGGGMTVVVGRLRPCPVLHLKLEVLSHNVERGAAGGTLLIAELMAFRGALGRRVPG